MNSSNVPDFKWSLVLKPDLLAVVSKFKLDLEAAHSTKHSQVIVSMIGYIVSKAEFVKVIPLDTLNELAAITLKVAMKEKDKKVYISCLWGFAMGKFPRSLYMRFSDQLIDTIICAMTSQVSSVVIYESLRLLLFLIETVGSSVIEKSVDFYPEVFPRLFHPAHRIRVLAVTCTTYLLGQKDTVEVLRNIVKKSIPEIKGTYCGLLSSQMSGEHAAETLNIWTICVRMLWKELHTDIGLINSMLSPIEKSFKSYDSLIRVQAFKCWMCLINNFSLDNAVLNSSKRLKLLVTPFLSNNAKNELTINAKIGAWWHLIVVLGSQATIHFDLIVLPLLKYSFKVATLALSGSPNVSVLASRQLGLPITNASGKTNNKEMQDIFIHIFVQLISKNDIGDKSVSTYIKKSSPLPPLKNGIITQEIYNKYHLFIHKCFGEILDFIAIAKMSPTIATHTVQYILKLLSGNIEGNSLRDGADVLRDMFAVLNTKVRECRVGGHAGVVVLYVLSSLLCGKNALPTTILSSRQYQLASCAAGNIMRGTLASSLSEVLLQLPLLYTAHVHQDRLV